MAYEGKSFQQRVIDMTAKVLAETGVNDVNPNSVLLTILETAAQEDTALDYKAFKIISNYYLDKTTGDDLDVRGEEFDVFRNDAVAATSLVTISDTSFTKVQTKIWAGNPGPVSGDTQIFVENAGNFDASGSVIIGRNTNNVETVPYSSITNFGSFFRINLSSALTNDHGTEESVILSQGGNRIIPIGTIVKVPESDTSREISYSVSKAATILDGDTSVENVSITALEEGNIGNVPPNTIIEFENEPFDNATVTNPFFISNGSARESDDDYRDRIKDKIQSLSKGTKRSIVFTAQSIELSSTNQRIVSGNIREPNDPTEHSYLYVDDGTGLEPSFKSIGTETIIESSTGGEQFLNLKNFPVIKAELETQNTAPYTIVDGDTLIIEVNDIAETLIFNDSDFEIEGSATAFEVVTAINDRMNLIEARTSNNGSTIVIRAKENTNENIQVTGGTANASNILNFSTEEVETLKLYKITETDVELLEKDGDTAALENNTGQPYALVGGETLTIVVDGKTGNTQTVTFQAGDFVSPGTAQASEVATAINNAIAGAEALVTSNGQNVTIKSKTLNSSDSKIQVTGGTANAILNYDTTEVTGKNKTYTLNRFNGQIELENVATVGEKYEVGTLQTRAFIVCSNPGTYTLLNGDTLEISVDGAASQTVTFLTADFSDISLASADEVIAVINRDVNGVIATKTNSDKIKISTSNWDSSGSIEITNATGNATVFGFDLNVEKINLAPHAATLTSQNAENYGFSEGETLTVVIDKDSLNNTYNITMDLDCTVTIGDNSAPYNTFFAKINSTDQSMNLRFLNDNDLKDFKVIWKSGLNAPGTAFIQSYDADTNEIVLTSAESNDINVGDTFTIVPVTAKNVATYFNNTVVSSLPSVATTYTADNGTKVQIVSKNAGADSAVQVTGGDANTILNFSTTQTEGINGYSQYTDIIEVVQKVIDGIDADLDNFPGVRAAGTQIEVLPPVVRKLKLDLNVTLKSGGFTLSNVKDKVISAASQYINGLGVGEDVVLEEIRCAVKKVLGIYDISITNHSVNIAIADNEISRISDNDIQVT